MFLTEAILQRTVYNMDDLVKLAEALAAKAKGKGALWRESRGSAEKRRRPSAQNDKDR